MYIAMGVDFMSKELGNALRFLRKRAQYTQKQVAEMLHIDRSTYAYYEGGTTEPDLKSINKLSKIFGVDPVVLLPDTDGSVNVYVCDVTPPEEEQPRAQESEEDLFKRLLLQSMTLEECELVLWYRNLDEKQKASLKDKSKKDK